MHYITCIAISVKNNRMRLFSRDIHLHPNSACLWEYMREKIPDFFNQNQSIKSFQRIQLTTPDWFINQTELFLRLIYWYSGPFHIFLNSACLWQFMGEVMPDSCTHDSFESNLFNELVDPVNKTQIGS